MLHVRTVQDIKRLGTIMGIWAHPDDETFLSGGVMAAAVRNGQTVVCITATKGEAGKYDRSKWPGEQLGDIRAGELERALKITGVKHHYYLGCQDGCCCDSPSPGIITRLCHLIERYEPDTVLTFGPEGWSGHPDHCQVSRWVKDAVVSADSKPKVYHVFHTFEQYEEYLRPIDKKLDFFFNIPKPPLTKPEDCAICFELPPEIRELKYQALLVMPSQTEKLLQTFPKEFISQAIGAEYFRQVK